MDSLERVLKSSAPISDPHLRVFLNVLVTGVWLQKSLNDLLKPYSITEPQFNVLRILRGQKGAAMNLYEIGDRMVHPTSNVSRIVDKLLEKGYLERKESEVNRRRVDISITRAGLNLLETLDPAFDNAIKLLTSRCTQEEALQLSDAIEALRGV